MTLNSIGFCAKRKTSKETTAQKMYMGIYNECNSLTSRHEIILDDLTGI